MRTKEPLCGALFMSGKHRPPSRAPSMGNGYHHPRSVSRSLAVKNRADANGSMPFGLTAASNAG